MKIRDGVDILKLGFEPDYDFLIMKRDGTVIVENPACSVRFSEGKVTVDRKGEISIAVNRDSNFTDGKVLDFLFDLIKQDLVERGR